MDDHEFDAPRSARLSGTGPEPLTDTDLEHLRILSILHYVSAGLSALGMCFAGLWTAAVLSMAGVGFPEGVDGPRGAAGPPAAFLGMMGTVGLAMVLFSLVTLVAQVLAGRNLRERRGRTLCLAVAAIECLNMPLGTLLGVFTFVVLSRPSVQAAFEANEAARADPYRPSSDF